MVISGSCQQFRRLSAVLLLLAGISAEIEAACDPQETRLSFDLTTTGLPEEVMDLIKSSSGLLVRDDSCFRSLSRMAALLADDQEMFRKILRSEGFYGAAIDTSRTRSGGTINIRMVIDATSPYLNISPEIEGLDDLELAVKNALSGLANTGLVAGSRSRSADIVLTEEQLLQHLRDNGHLFATVANREVLVDHAKKDVAVTWTLSPGQQIALGEPVYMGLERTRESWLDSIRNWESGQTGNPRLLSSWRKRLRETGLFSSIELIPELRESGDDIADVTAHLLEAPPRRIELGLGYSTGLGAEGRASWRHKNFAGRGQTLSTALRIGEKTQSLEGKWRIPYFNRADQVLQIDALAAHEQRPAYEAWRLKGGVGLERRLGKSLKGSIGISTSFEEVQEDERFESFLLAGLPLGIGLDTTDSLFDPVRGNRISLRIKPTLSALHDRFTFVTSEARASHYWPLRNDQRIVLASRIRVASIIGPSLETIPATERLYAGGGGSVRGYGFQRLGPMDEDNQPTGGRSVVEGSLELRYRTEKFLGFIVFADAGSVSPDTEPTLNEMRYAVGAGLRYYTSFAPVRLDLATPIKRRTGESRVALYISIGQSF